MKYLPLFLFLVSLTSFAQSKTAEEYVGQYAARIDSTSRMVIRKEGNDFSLEIVGQGRVALSMTGKDKFSVDRVRPKTTIEFLRNASGKTVSFQWQQTVPEFHLKRITPALTDSIASKDNLAPYTGNFQLNPQQIWKFRVVHGRLTVKLGREGTVVLTRAGDHRFELVDADLKLSFDFAPGANGQLDRLSFRRIGFPVFELVNESADTGEVYGFLHPKGFTRVDSLRGMLTPLRTCYDVLSYDLNVVVDPVAQTIGGHNKIRFRAVNAFDHLQVDLFGNMKISQILYHNTILSFTREFNAVFVQFPSMVEAGTMGEIDIYYAGRPQVPDINSMAGGVFWLQDKAGQDWIETVTQGSAPACGGRARITSRTNPTA